MQRKYWGKGIPCANCGAEIPRWMRLKFEGFLDDSASIRAFGLDVVTALCEKLLAAVVPSRPTWVRVIDEDLAHQLGWFVNS